VGLEREMEKGRKVVEACRGEWREEWPRGRNRTRDHARGAACTLLMRSREGTGACVCNAHKKAVGLLGSVDPGSRFIPIGA